jgi:hypothetical protein
MMIILRMILKMGGDESEIPEGVAEDETTSSSIEIAGGPFQSSFAGTLTGSGYTNRQSQDYSKCELFAFHTIDQQPRRPT